MILRAVFGLDAGARLDGLRELLTRRCSTFGAKPASILLPRCSATTSAAARGAASLRMRARADELIFELIDERRDGDAERDDVLAMLLAARHEDGSPMSDAELRDELMTLLVAGHETTASELAWAFERLAREPAVLDRLRERDRRRRRRRLPDGDDPGDACAAARCCPTPRRGWSRRRSRSAAGDYPPGVCLVANAYLVHHDPDDLPRPLRLPARALPRAPAGHLHLDPVRRRPPPLPRRELRDAGDEDRPARGAFERCSAAPAATGASS